MEVTELVEPHGLMVICEPEEQYKAINALVKKAEVECICPSVISIVKVEDKFSITLWGDR